MGNVVLPRTRVVPWCFPGRATPARPGRPNAWPRPFPGTESLATGSYRAWQRGCWPTKPVLLCEALQPTSGWAGAGTASKTQPTRTRWVVMAGREVTEITKSHQPWVLFRNRVVPYGAIQSCPVGPELLNAVYCANATRICAAKEPHCSWRREALRGRATTPWLVQLTHKKRPPASSVPRSGRLVAALVAAFVVPFAPVAPTWPSLAL